MYYRVWNYNSLDKETKQKIDSLGFLFWVIEDTKYREIIKDRNNIELLKQLDIKPAEATTNDKNLAEKTGIDYIEHLTSKIEENETQDLQKQQENKQNNQKQPKQPKQPTVIKKVKEEKIKDTNYQLKWNVVLPTETIYRLNNLIWNERKNSKNKNEIQGAIILYLNYLETAEQQKTQQIYANDIFFANRLNVSRQWIARKRAILEKPYNDKQPLIESIYKGKWKSKKHYIKLNFYRTNHKLEEINEKKSLEVLERLYTLTDKLHYYTSKSEEETEILNKLEYFYWITKRYLNEINADKPAGYRIRAKTVLKVCIIIDYLCNILWIEEVEDRYTPITINSIKQIFYPTGNIYIQEHRGKNLIILNNRLNFHYTELEYFIDFVKYNKRDTENITTFEEFIGQQGTYLHKVIYDFEDLPLKAMQKANGDFYIVQYTKPQYDRLVKKYWKAKTDKAINRLNDSLELDYTNAWIDLHTADNLEARYWLKVNHYNLLTEVLEWGLYNKPYQTGRAEWLKRYLKDF